MATTTTSTTTTTTTLSGGIVPQQTSRGDITNQNSIQSNQDSTKNNITSPGIVNIFMTSIKPDDVAIVDTTASTSAVNEMANGMGYLPIVWYNAFQIDLENIEYLSLYDDGIAPCMKLTFTDTMGLMKDKAFPLDDTKIELFLSSRSDQLKPIFLQFKIKDFSNNNGLLSINATMDVNKLYIKKFQSYPNMTSSQALQSVCKDIGFGFNTNIIDTNDSMTWINAGDRPYDFMIEVTDHGYISDQSFLIGYIDHYYNFNYIDIQKELLRDISNELGVISNGIADILKIVDTNNSNIGKLLLTNDASVSGQNIYFDTFTVINNSTSISLENGYKDSIKYYDILDKSLLYFNIDSLNTNSSSSIVLKGAPQDETFFNTNINYDYVGKIDSDNMHKNYHYTNTNNVRNINDAQKISMNIELPTPNYNVYKFQKIKVILSSNTPTPAAPMINQRLSGDWLIVDIKFMYYDKSLRQVISLVKRELELSDEELAQEPPQNNTSSSLTGTRGSYTNPIVNSNFVNNPILGASSSNSNIYQCSGTKTPLSISGYPTGYFKTNYPNLPIVTIVHTTISIQNAVQIIKQLPFNANILSSTFALLYEESNKDTTNFIGINNNYGGAQTDSGCWGNPQYFTGQVALVDNSKAPRMFAQFTSFQTFAQFIAQRLQSKGFTSATNANQWAMLYIEKWYSPVPSNAYSSYFATSDGQKTLAEKTSIYNSAIARYA